MIIFEIKFTLIQLIKKSLPSKKGGFFSFKDIYDFCGNFQIKGTRFY